MPVIIRWPGAAAPGSISGELVTSSDFYPTILAATGLPLNPDQHMDGVDLTPVLKGMGPLNRDAIYWHYPHYNQHPESFAGSVIRKGDWKLIERLDTNSLELYDLKSDVGEQRNLAKRNPEKAKELFELLNSWRQDVGAQPMRPNPHYEGN